MESNAMKIMHYYNNTQTTWPNEVVNNSRGVGWIQKMLFP